MKTILLLTAVLVLAGCGDRKGAAAGADTSGMAPAMADRHAGMTHSDSTMTRDTGQEVRSQESVCRAPGSRSGLFRFQTQPSRSSGPKGNATTVAG